MPITPYSDLFPTNCQADTVSLPGEAVSMQGEISSNAQHVILLLDRLGRLTRELQFVDGLNPAQWETLRFLAQANRYSRTPTALAEYLGATKGTVSQTLISLESKGLVDRCKKTCDRRQVAITLTEAGEAMLQRDPMRSLEKSICAMTADCGGALVTGLTRLLTELQHRREVMHFGVCEDCTMFCAEHGKPKTVPHAASGEPKRCGMTGETLNDGECRQLCVNYKAAAAE
ncbi:MarR family transcriptional regulator [Ferrovibrio sp.]|uniref:MarR family winged helix-turn-helix transcriptional regulator n=1 Tax=Ferrovibrio sp. TaxID=1917215 RepID=UPI0025C6E731|nr:MarR family transcriptional regulator [Ferrovibrio sp.]MBX3454758.1 MarR family transcriptional regulator [Ferrovibrio sp.]